MDGILYTPRAPPTCGGGAWNAQWGLWAPPQPQPGGGAHQPGAIVVVTIPEQRVRTFMESRVGAPETTARFIGERFCNRSAAPDLGARGLWVMDAVLRSPIKLEVGTDRALHFFKSPHLTIHASELSDEECALLKVMMHRDRWSQYFGDRGVLFTGNESRVVQYRDFLFNNVVSDVLNPVKLCARLFALLLSAALADGAVGQMRLVLEGVLIDYTGAGAHDLRLLHEVLVDGLLLLIKRQETEGT